MPIPAPQGRAVRTVTAEPTRRQARILAFIESFRGAHGYSPTLQEIGDHFGRSKVTVLGHVRALRRKGLLIVCGRYRHRSLRPTGLWSPPAGPHRPGDPVVLQRQLDGLLDVCREVLAAERLPRRLKKKLENAVQLAAAQLPDPSLPALA